MHPPYFSEAPRRETCCYTCRHYDGNTGQDTCAVCRHPACARVRQFPEDGCSAHEHLPVRPALSAAAIRSTYDDHHTPAVRALILEIADLRALVVRLIGLIRWAARELRLGNGRLDRVIEAISKVVERFSAAGRAPD